MTRRFAVGSSLLMPPGNNSSRAYGCTLSRTKTCNCRGGSLAENPCHVDSIILHTVSATGAFKAVNRCCAVPQLPVIHRSC